MLFTYKAMTQGGEKRDGEIDAPNRDFALKALQERGLYPTEILEKGKKTGDINIPFIDNLLNGVKAKDVVIMSRQIATLFTSQVSAVKAFSMLASNSDSKALQKVLQTIVDDIQSGTAISGAMSKHPKVFSSFYVNMVKAGEESGKLPQVFSRLADYLDRQYALNSKIKNALIYPSFIMFIFFTVMVLMFTKVIPNLAKIIRESGVEIPSYTKVVIGISDLMVNYGFFMLLGIVGFFSYIYYVTRSKAGRDR
jgi:type IV pilus assembly protein PilC